MGAPGLERALSAEALFAVDEHQRIVAWNGEAARVFGYDGSAALGLHCYQVVNGCDDTGHRFCRAACPVITAAGVGSAMPPMRLQARTRAGSRVPIDVSTIVISSGRGVGPVIHLCRANGHARPAQPAATAIRHPLTNRESQILKRLCRGEGTEQMATELAITVTTVRNHVQRLIHKLGVHNRAEAIALAFQVGLAP